VLSPKTRGAWNLHVLTADDPLDHFVLFSSVAALLEDPGQGAYAAANAFLDGLAHQRRAAGRPALAIDWGPWAQVGMAAHLGARMEARGFAMIPLDAGVAALLDLMGGTLAQVAVLPRPRRTMPRGPVDGAVMSSEPNMTMRLTSAGEAERPALLADLVAEHLAQVLGLREGQALDRAAAFSDVGMDSLMLIELRNRLQRVLQLNLSSTIAFDYPTVERLSAYLDRRLAPAEDTAQGDAKIAPEGQPGVEDLRAQLDRELEMISTRGEG
jgi:myxalamid-type polyketide synthase MxaC